MKNKSSDRSVSRFHTSGSDVVAIRVQFNEFDTSRWTGERISHRFMKPSGKKVEGTVHRVGVTRWSYRGMCSGVSRTSNCLVRQVEYELFEVERVA